MCDRSSTELIIFLSNLKSIAMYAEFIHMANAEKNRYQKVI